MQAHLLVGPIPIKVPRGFSSAISGHLLSPLFTRICLDLNHNHRCRRHRDNRSRCRRDMRWKTTIAAASSSSSSWSSQSSASISGGQNHYVVLGIARNATAIDIKRAYRMLARKFHPDVNKDSAAGELFKSIRRAYEVLSNDATRIQYDRALKLQENSKFYRVKKHYNPEVEDNMKYYYNEAAKRHRSRYQRFYEHYTSHPNSPFHSETDTEQPQEEETTTTEQSSFISVLKSAFLSMLLLNTLGCLASLTFSTFTALLDKDLDMGYKLGYMIAWILGGKGGILLTLCLTFASWLCGKASSSTVVLMVVAMWVGSNLARHAPLPQGALLTLLYMSIKLQSDSMPV